jgi:Domain of unknown function (DUF4062)
VGLEPILLEQFPAKGASLEASIDAALRSADVVVLIVAFRYGFVPVGQERGSVEAEFEAARRLNKPVLAYMASDNMPWPTTRLPTSQDELTRVNGFRRRLRHSTLVKYFSNADELGSMVGQDLARWRSDLAVEAPRANAVAPEPSVGSILLEIRSQLALLVQRTLASPQAPSSPSVYSQPAAFLGPPADAVDPKRVFAIMPYSMEWSEGVERVLREACVSAGATFDIAKSSDGRLIIRDIWHGITGSGIVIADLTGANANVAYEVGLADVLGRNVVLISQEDEVPVDFRGSRLIVYKNSIAGSLALRESLIDRLRRLIPS